MKSLVKHRRGWLLIGLCLALVFSLGSGVVEAKKDKASNKCEGTKKQRKQKMDKREITDAQLASRQGSDDLKARGVSEDLERVSYESQLVLATKSGSSRLDGPWIDDVEFVFAACRVQRRAVAGGNV